MAPKHEESSKRVMNRGAWTADEDKKLSQCIEIHGPRRWKTLAFKSGLKRCGKSCRLRWLNYLRPNVKRGNITEAEEDLILRLHKLLGNRWSLIAGRLPGRTDNEIKNYWNSHLSKKINNQLQQKTPQPSIMLPPAPPQETAPPLPKVGDVNTALAAEEKGSKETTGNNFDFNFDMNQLFDFSAEGNSYGLEWVNKFLELDDHDTWDISSQKIR